jgi:single-strand DNA-binding protein
MIKMFLIGNLGKDAIVNTLQSGKTVINFSCAHTETFKDAQGEKKEKTTWVDCAWWTDSTAIAPYLKKGTKVFLEGTPDLKMFDRQDGSKGATLTLRVFACQLLGGNNSQQSQQAPVQEQATTTNISYQKQADQFECADDLPF